MTLPLEKEPLKDHTLRGRDLGHRTEEEAQSKANKYPLFKITNC